MSAATVRRSRSERQAATRQGLLRAASRRFLRDGYAATTLADIAEEAGVTKGAVYSNFASKEDLFLGLLREPMTSAEKYAPSLAAFADGSGKGTGGRDRSGPAAGRAFGAYAHRVLPSRRHVALFLETNAVALRSERVRAWVADNTRGFLVELGEGLRDAFDAPDVDPLALGLIAQSLYVGLMMHGAFLDEVDAATFELAFAALAAGVAGAASGAHLDAGVLVAEA